ncbi:MAG: Ubiquinone/menaquinone biosynthesis C-methyltransferase UbiE [Planctomycetes bacterium]|nr:Ubiquinone/menaquinone biosynthesis C-methyltransferase UbiE [Planctomycetota bacterium]
MRTMDDPPPREPAARETTSRWRAAGTVGGFVSARPNEALLAFAEREFRPGGANRCLDIGCGAARNAVPLARAGWSVTGIDLSPPMIDAARSRAASEGVAAEFVHGPMEPLPFADGSFDLVVAHGVWNLARSGGEFRRAVREAARVSRAGAGLFVFTFARDTLPSNAVPDAGETFVHSSWNGEPCVFLTEGELLGELASAGFAPCAPPVLLNAGRRGEIRLAGAPPVLWEAAFRRV